MKMGVAEFDINHGKRIFVSVWGSERRRRRYCRNMKGPLWELPKIAGWFYDSFELLSRPVRFGMHSECSIPVGIKALRIRDLCNGMASDATSRESPKIGCEEVVREEKARRMQLPALSLGMLPDANPERGEDSS
jgi:hypothetical protein